jgi:hypothetical protein
VGSLVRARSARMLTPISSLGATPIMAASERLTRRTLSVSSWTTIKSVMASKISSQWRLACSMRVNRRAFSRAIAAWPAMASSKSRSSLAQADGNVRRGRAGRRVLRWNREAAPLRNRSSPDWKPSPDPAARLQSRRRSHRRAGGQFGKGLALSVAAGLIFGAATSVDGWPRFWRQIVFGLGGMILPDDRRRSLG